MNGTTEVNAGSATSGAHSLDNTSGSTEGNAQILRALELIHDPRSSNVLRQDASRYLEQMRSQPEAPYLGYILADNKSHPAISRHYGLSLLEYAVQHRWTDYTAEQSKALRDWTLKLAESVSRDDPLFIRNKIAQLWVDIAKVSWGLDWADMDELLVRLWQGSLTQKEFVLLILETLSDDSFGREDVNTGLRGNELNKACVEIFTPADILAHHFPTREKGLNVRFGEDGWILRISNLLSWCNEQGHTNEELQNCTIRALSVLRSVAGWAILKALKSTRCIHHVINSLLAHDGRTQLAAVEALYMIYNRPRFSDEDIQDLVWPMYDQATVGVLKQVYAMSSVDVNDMDQEKYLLSKKFSEVIHNIGRFLEEKPTLFINCIDVNPFLDLLLQILQHQSLHVSIPVLHLWVKLLDSDAVGNSPMVMNLIAPLLETCSQRLLRYEALPEDSNIPSIIYLNEDVDTTPERHAFLGNYARFCNQVVQSIVAKRPFDAIHHILSQADQVISNLYDGESAFDVQTYAKVSVPSLKLDAQLSVVEAALKGYSRWSAKSLSIELVPRSTAPLRIQTKQSQDPQREAMTLELQTWSLKLMDLTLEDPSMKQRIVQTAVEFAASSLKHHVAFIHRVFNFIIDTRAVRQLENGVLSESVKELHSFCIHQLQRLALRSFDELILIHDHIQRKIEEFCTVCNLDRQDRMRCSSLLFIIAQRATGIDDAQREQQLHGFVQPLIQEWQSPELSTALNSFSGFCDLLGLNGLSQYFESRNLHQVSDWPGYPLDEEGKVLQAQIQNALEKLPLHPTKTLMSVSIEKVQYGSRAHKVACDLWSSVPPVVLPNLLQLISRAHSFHNPMNWTDLPPEMRGVVGRILTDRFWQVGISTGSRIDFYARVGGSKSSMEGLASTIRAALRTVRETGYRLLFCMSLLGNDLYGYDELPGPLSKALFEESCSLSTHQTSMLVDMIHPVIANCPTDRRSQFLPPIMSAMFSQLDQKVSTEWERIEERNRAASADDSLTEEMRDESILRQLTFTSVTMVVGLLDPNRINPREEAMHGSSSNAPPSRVESPLREFILRTPDVLKPIILFCTHALRMHDTRSCGLITRVLRSITPEFSGETPMVSDVREFISTEVFKACITSINDPYFVDTQNDLAGLTACILTHYSGRTDTPRQILLSLPDMTPELVDSTMKRMFRAQYNSRQQKSIILKLLEGVRGISISEQGRMPKPDTKKIRSALHENYMTVDAEPKTHKDPSPDLSGVAGMFG